MNNLVKNIGIWLVIGLVVITVVKQFDARQTTREAVSYSDFMDQAKQGKVDRKVVKKPMSDLKYDADKVHPLFV